QGGNEGADQPLAGEVNALTEGPAEHGESHLPAVPGETVEKGPARRLVHACGLHLQRNAGPVRLQQLDHLLEVAVAAEKGQVVARPLTVLLGNQLAYRQQAVGPVLVAGGQVADIADL